MIYIFCLNKLNTYIKFIYQQLNELRLILCSHSSKSTYNNINKLIKYCFI